MVHSGSVLLSRSIRRAGIVLLHSISSFVIRNNLELLLNKLKIHIYSSDSDPRIRNLFQHECFRISIFSIQGRVHDVCCVTGL
jgi:hypothetical protein